MNDEDPPTERASPDDRRDTASTVNESLGAEYHGKLLPEKMPAVTKVLEYSVLQGTPRAILVSIASYARRDGTFTISPGNAAIAHRAKVHRRTVQRWLKPAKGYEALLASGELEILHRGGSRRGDTHTYFVALIPKVQKGDIQLSPIPEGVDPSPKGDIPGVKGDISGVMGDSGVAHKGSSKGSLKGSGFSCSRTENGDSLLPFPKGGEGGGVESSNDNDGAAAPSPPVGEPRPEPSADDNGDSKAEEYAARVAAGKKLREARLSKQRTKAPEGFR